MGRHAAPALGRGHTPRSEDVAAWGAFTVPLSVVVLLVVGISWPTVTAVGLLGALAFGAVWLATRLTAGAGSAERHGVDERQAA